MHWQSFSANGGASKAGARDVLQALIRALLPMYRHGPADMYTDLNFANDEWFWKAWSETISKRYAKALHGQYSKQANTTIVNERSLASSEFLEQYAALVMLLERFPAAPGSLAVELSNWRPRSYEDYFHSSGLRDAQFAIAAFASAPATVRRPFLAAVAQLDDESIGAVEAVSQLARQGRADLLPRLCRERAQKLRTRIDEVAHLIATAEKPDSGITTRALSPR